jgi:soluble lytic murein transglycosylase-like protein
MGQSPDFIAPSTTTSAPFPSIDPPAVNGADTMRRTGMMHAKMAVRGRLLAPAVVAGVVLVLTAESVPGSLGLDSPSQQRSDAIFDYIVLKNPEAPIDRLDGFPEALLAISREVGLDHCLALAQAEVESSFWPDAVGKAGEIGLYQVLPSTATSFGRSRAELFDPHVNTRVALSYFSDILGRRPALRDALAEYNGGPRNRSPYYALTVLENYARVLRHADLACEPQRNPEFARAEHREAMIPERWPRSS